MANQINNFVTNMQPLQENQDGTLKGGFVSVTEGRYRIIIGGGTKPTAYEYNTAAGDCGGTNAACTNRSVCAGSTNNKTGGASCSNVQCQGIVQHTGSAVY